MAALAGVNILIMLPVWLAGVWLNHSAWAKTIPAERALFYLLGCMAAMLLISRWDLAALFALRDVMPMGLGMSEWIVSDLAVSAVVVVALAALRPLAERHATWLERYSRPIRYASGFSFSLYLFHAPVLAVLVHFGITAGDSVLGLASILALVTAICAGIAALTERRTPALRRAMERLFAPQAKTAALTTKAG